MRVGPLAQPVPGFQHFPGLFATRVIVNHQHQAGAGGDPFDLVQETLAVDERALFLWDGRRYFCHVNCIPDDEQSTAVRLAVESPSPETLASELSKSRITHLLLSKPDVNWFMTYHDPQGMHRETLDYFTDTFFPACGKLVYSDEAMSLYEITCR